MGKSVNTFEKSGSLKALTNILMSTCIPHILVIFKYRRYAAETNQVNFR